MVATLSAKLIDVESLIDSEDVHAQKRLIEFKRIIDFKRDIEDELKEITAYKETLEDLENLMNRNQYLAEDKGMRNKRPSLFSGTRSGTRSIQPKAR